MLAQWPMVCALSNLHRVVLFAGRLVYYKGLEYLIVAVRGLGVKLLIAGEGPLQSALEKQIRELAPDVWAQGPLDIVAIVDAAQ